MVVWQPFGVQLGNPKLAMFAKPRQQVNRLGKHDITLRQGCLELGDVEMMTLRSATPWDQRGEARGLIGPGEQ
jgi:hypothetical protein